VEYIAMPSQPLGIVVELSPPLASPDPVSANNPKEDKKLPPFVMYLPPEYPSPSKLKNAEPAPGIVVALVTTGDNDDLPT
jgi:hypothetical protein